jgi:hypothetical protein
MKVSALSRAASKVQQLILIIHAARPCLFLGRYFIITLLNICDFFKCRSTGRSNPLSLQAMRRWREAPANVLYECDWMIECMLENIKNKQKEWHTATKPLNIFFWSRMDVGGGGGPPPPARVGFFLLFPYLTFCIVL